MILSFFSTIISHNEREKSKDYRNVVIIQIVIIISGLVLSSFIDFANPTGKGKLIITIFSAFGVIYSFLLWDLLKDLTKSRTLVRIVLATLVFIAILGFLANSLIIKF